MGLAHRLGHSVKRVSHFFFFLHHFKAMTRSDSSKCVASSRLRSFHNKRTSTPRPGIKRKGAVFCFFSRGRAGSLRKRCVAPRCAFGFLLGITENERHLAPESIDEENETTSVSGFHNKIAWRWRPVFPLLNWSAWRGYRLDDLRAQECNLCFKRASTGQITDFWHYNFFNLS